MTLLGLNVLPEKRPGHNPTEAKPMARSPATIKSIAAIATNLFTSAFRPPRHKVFKLSASESKEILKK
jgi:hypothetical protein